MAGAPAGQRALEGLSGTDFTGGAASFTSKPSQQGREWLSWKALEQTCLMVSIRA